MVEVPNHADHRAHYSFQWKRPTQHHIQLTYININNSNISTSTSHYMHHVYFNMNVSHMPIYRWDSPIQSILFLFTLLLLLSINEITDNGSLSVTKIWTLTFYWAIPQCFVVHCAQWFFFATQTIVLLTTYWEMFATKWIFPEFVEFRDFFQKFLESNSFFWFIVNCHHPI